MNQTQDYTSQSEIEQLIGLLSAKDLLKEKTRINLYLPKIIVKLIDTLAKNTSRGELVSSLVVEKIKTGKKLPYGMFSPVEISEKEIDEITSQWSKTANELT